MKLDRQGSTRKDGKSVNVYRFERLVAWQRAVDFCVKAYKLTKSFPRDEAYGLTSQLRRASASIVLNIAEGSGSSSNKEFAQFLAIAVRSQYEVVAILKLCERLGYISPEVSQELTAESSEVGKLVQGLKNSLSVD